ncbi:ankyrin repeat domain-containing protein [Roseateles sp. GG27B]
MDQINVNGQYVLAARNGRVERVASLLAEGAKVNSRDRNGDSPLNMAATSGNMPLVELLLKSGADVNLANLAGVTPLMGAAQLKRADHAGAVEGRCCRQFCGSRQKERCRLCRRQRLQ